MFIKLELGAHQCGTTICEINLGSWHKGSRSTWWREKHQFCPAKIEPSRQPLQWDPLPLKLWTVLLNCGIDFRFGMHPCSGLGVCPWKIKLLEVLWLFYFLCCVFPRGVSSFRLPACFISSSSFRIVEPASIMAAEYIGQHLKLNSTHCWELTKSVMMLREPVTSHHVAVKGLCTHVPGLSKVSEHRCRWCWRYLVYCSKHWKITFPCFDFLARFLGFGFSLFPPQ